MPIAPVLRGRGLRGVADQRTEDDERDEQQRDLDVVDDGIAGRGRRQRRPSPPVAASVPTMSRTPPPIAIGSPGRRCLRRAPGAQRKAAAGRSLARHRHRRGQRATANSPPPKPISRRRRRTAQPTAAAPRRSPRRRPRSRPARRRAGHPVGVRARVQPAAPPARSRPARRPPRARSAASSRRHRQAEDLAAIGLQQHVLHVEGQRAERHHGQQPARARPRR